MIRWNAIAIAGAGAFVLSFLLGLLSGSFFGIILLRAVIFGVVFSGICGAGFYLIDKFIPELFQPGSDIPQEKGEGVDITLPEENPIESNYRPEEIETDTEPIDTTTEQPVHRYFSSSFNTSSIQEEGREATLEDNDEEMEYLSEDNTTDDIASEENILPSFNREKAIDVGESMREGDSEDGFLEDDAEKSEVTESENIDSSMEDGEQEESALYAETDINGPDNAPEAELDVLPDMGNFESSFSQFPGNQDTSGGVTFDSFSSNSFNEKKANEDPATYAKAVRTIIKRQEKG